MRYSASDLYKAKQVLLSKLRDYNHKEEKLTEEERLDRKDLVEEIKTLDAAFRIKYEEEVYD